MFAFLVFILTPFLFKDPEPTIQELEAFYRDKISDLNKNHEDVVRMLKFRLRRFENRNADDEYMVNGTDF